MKRDFKTALLLLCVLLPAGRAFAQVESTPPARAELERLADEIRAHPTDYDKTYSYVLLAAELKDYDAAIGALERLLMFNPNLGRARKELGFLYARVGAYPSAAFNLRAALEAPDLEPGQKAQIEAQLPDIEKQTQASRFSGSLHVGVRTQSNAAYVPLGGLYEIGGVQTFSPSGRQSDTNTFQSGQIAHDYDLQNQRGDVIETRGLLYATQQFALPQYNVALFSGSVGPRFGLSEIAPGLSVKPFVAGAVSLVGDLNYVNTGGAGLSFRQTFGDRLFLEPAFEWSQLWVNPGGAPGASTSQTLASLATGDVFTGSVGGSLRLFDNVKLEGRTAFSRANSYYVASQGSNQVDVQAMLRLEVDPPLAEIPRRWTIAPYARFTQLAFDAPNYLVDFLHARRDEAWTYGIALDAPVAAQLGFSGHLEFLRNDSNISSYKMQNVSVTFGPVAKF
jgi:hypothetical protein